jgi:curved DNA-binding protein CbpA
MHYNCYMSILAPEQDLYAILEVTSSADASQIKNSYRRLVRINHPDANPYRRNECEALMKDIIEAYAILSDPQKRDRYDREVRLRALAQSERNVRQPAQADFGEPASLIGKVRYALGIAPADFASRLGLTDIALKEYEQRDAIPQAPVQFRTFINIAQQAIGHLESLNQYSKAGDIRTALERKRNQRSHYR